MYRMYLIFFPLFVGILFDGILWFFASEVYILLTYGSDYPAITERRYVLLNANTANPINIQLRMNLRTGIAVK